MDKKSVSSRIPVSIVEAMEKARQAKGHRFYDRKDAYIIAKVLEDWANKEKK